MERILAVADENRVPRAAFAFMRIFLGVMWLYEIFRGAPWAYTAGAVGVLLLLGLLTPPAAVFGAVLLIAVLGQANSPEAWGIWPWLYWALALMHVVAAFTAAGRVWGVDGLLARRKPLWPLW